METKIYDTLLSLGLASKATSYVFSNSTRDIDNLEVWRDHNSNVIYIKDHYVGDQQYKDSSYRKWSPVGTKDHDFEERRDVVRRFNAYKSYLWDKKVCDFGCGSGQILKQIKDISLEAIGIEIQEKHLIDLKKNDIKCYQDFQPEHENYFDTISVFHVLEHLPDPLSLLSQIYRSLKIGGKIIVEVPHANDFLLREFLDCESYKNFTLWSQHLVLHTRNSLTAFLRKVGFEVEIINGVQRYPLSNHLNWLANGKPGGHKGVLSNIDSPSLLEHYSAALNKIDATDTLVAIATKIQR